MRCDAKGVSETRLKTCEPSAGEHCSSRGCRPLCAEAEKERSYIGCEYWPVTTLNDELDERFAFAVVVANPQLVTAQIRIEREDEVILKASVPPGEVESFILPWVVDLRGARTDSALSVPSSLVSNGAYRLESDVPITVYQFNPLRYEQDDAFSFTNDASLLLPSSTLTGSYIAMSRGTMFVETSLENSVVRSHNPGFVAIVATEDNTEINFTSRAYTEATPDGEIPALIPGGTATFLLNRGDVAQITSARPELCPVAPFEEQVAAGTGSVVYRYCDVGAEYDLTGSLIQANAPVEVVGGHGCAFVPYNRFACDHLEEVLFPVEAWGDAVIVSATAPVQNEPNLVRIVAAEHNTSVRFEPAIVPSFTLEQGEFEEFVIESHVRVIASGPISVAQYLVGQNYEGANAVGADAGDPSMSLAIPETQFRNSYDVLAPSTYDRNMINVTVRSGAEVLLDGDPITNFSPVGTSEWQVARIQLTPGAHHLESSTLFGVVVYGFGRFTSYMVPGGLDLRPVNSPLL